MKRTLNSLWLITLFFISISLFAQDKTEVLLHTGKTVFPENVREYIQTATIGSDEMIEGHYYRFLQFYTLPDQARFDQLGQAGIELIEYIPYHTYLAAIPTDFEVADFEQLGVRSIQPLTTDLKMSADLKSNTFPQWATEGNGVLAMLKFHKNLSHENVERYCQVDGVDVLASNGYNNFLRTWIPFDKIQDIASLPYVNFLELVPPPSVPDDILGRSLHRANVIDAEFQAGRHYTGEGVAVLCRDDGIVGPHIDFQGRIDNSFATQSGPTHGDGVSGIMAGAGNLDPRNRGMAAGAFLYVTNYVADFLDETMDLHFDYDVLVTNSSYSNGCNVGYTQITQIVDQQLHENPTLMHVFSAGNSNNNNCGYGAGDQWGNITGGHKQSKNCIATANLFADASLVGSSSRGPAHDGRIKPDIAANGQNQISTDENNEYLVFGGTSGAAPGIAGITAQLHQAYRELNNGEIAEAPLLKAILMNTANDLGNIGPDFKFGWGHVNAYRAALTIEEGNYFKDGVEAGMINEHTITIPENVKQVRVMVYWSDPDASAFANKALINDLDIWMTDGASTEFLPWLLDPTPDPDLLDAPATKGVDNLNNVEQVAIEDPEAGEYTLHVQGADIPFMSHEYYVVWEFRTDEVTVIHPFGGEAFAPNETVRIHWDTYDDPNSFTIAYSLDGGATYTDAGFVNGTERMWDWDIPNGTISGNALIRVTRNDSGSSDVSDAAFTIARRPLNLNVVSACPNYIRIQWSPVDLSAAGSDTRYEILVLGDRYMEPIDTTDATEFDVPAVFGLGYPYWIAVRTLGDDGIRSERTNAINFSGGLFNCVLPNDMKLLEVSNPQPGNVSACGSFDAPVIVTVTNAGLLPQTDVQIGFQVNNEPMVVENIPGTIEPGDTVMYEFTSSMGIDMSGDYTVMVSTLLPNDEITMNDAQTVAFSLSFFPGVGTPIEYSEDFEGGVFPPDSYLVNNFDNSKTWTSSEVIGSNGDMTTCMFMDNITYNAQGEEDEILTIPIDLTTATAPYLTFDVSYAKFSDNFFDGLRVWVSGDCGSTFTELVYEKFGPELATAPNDNFRFKPANAGEWRTEDIDLTGFVGSSTVIKFVNVNGFGNSLYIDNINVKEATAPIAAFETATIFCEGETVNFISTSEGGGLSHEWIFGSGADPETSNEANVDVIFTEPGMYNVSLSVTNGLGFSMTSENVEVLAKVIPDFDVTINDNVVTFDNTTQFADTYLWKFGDGTFSVDEDPEHEYLEPGVYSVTLTATNDCGEIEIVKEIDLMFTGTNELNTRIAAQLTPNPTSGAFLLNLLNNRAETLQVQVLDIRGVVVESRKVDTHAGTNTVSFDAANMSSGLYIVKIQGADGWKAMKLVVE